MKKRNASEVSHTVPKQFLMELANKTEELSASIKADLNQTPLMNVSEAEYIQFIETYSSCVFMYVVEMQSRVSYHRITREIQDAKREGSENRQQS